MHNVDYIYICILYMKYSYLIIENAYLILKYFDLYFDNNKTFMGFIKY